LRIENVELRIRDLITSIIYKYKEIKWEETI